MSNKLGRNDPCPCGSGKKYKRCCLPAAEAAARERAQQEALLEDDVFGDLDLDADDEGGEFFEIEDDLTVLDRDTITRVCYTRGFVSKLSDLRSGRGVRITEWEAPQIPQALLETIEREAVDALEGEWGDPKSDSPMQVDIIDFETETDVVSIEVFNRAICLIDVDSEEMRRLDRLCDALEVATPEGPDQSVEEGNTAATAAIVSGKEVSQPSAGFDISAVLKSTGVRADPVRCVERRSRERAHANTSRRVCPLTTRRVLPSSGWCRFGRRHPASQPIGSTSRSTRKPSSTHSIRSCDGSGSSAVVISVPSTSAR